MQIIQNRTEESLIQSLRGGLNATSNKFCLHIRGGAFSDKNFSTIPELIETWIGRDYGSVFICYDRDIFVFSPNLSPETFAGFKDYFHEYYTYEPAARKRVLSFYDTENNGLGLIELAEGKLERRRQSEKTEQVRLKIETKARKGLNFSDLVLDDTLIETLRRRKKERHRLEILVVEDDPFSQKLISTALNGYVVSFAEDGHSAILKYLQKAPDIVFLDIELPDVKGHDVLAKILSFDHTAHIVMLSGNSQPENVKEAISSGAKGFIAKPFTRDRLFQTITKCSEHRLEIIGDTPWK